MERIPEPELMEDPAQARAYARADFAAVNQGFADRFRSTFPWLTRGRILDLGCGPADIPIRLARAVPGLRIVGVDGAAAMLEEARAALGAADPAVPVTLVRATLPRLPFRDRAFDAIVSNSLLHHLREPGALWAAIARLGRSGAAVLVMDLVRPETEEAARAIVEAAAATEPPLLKRDFHASLLASFTVEEVRRQLRAVFPRLECRLVSERHWLAWGRLD
jgi:ubiquinone/menaquinone biosynthesis C-methylase UbiE